MTISLAQAPLQRPLTLVSTQAAEPETCRRLSTLGLRCGSTLCLLSCTAGGGRVVSVSGARIALDKSVLSQLMAEEISA